jgi:hypothetical protein
MVKKRSKYRSAPIEEALQSAFGKEDRLFGSSAGPTRFNTKVAVLSTTVTGDGGIIMANYNRSDGAAGDYLDLPRVLRFDRPLLREQELLLWEAYVPTQLLMRICVIH